MALGCEVGGNGETTTRPLPHKCHHPVVKINEEKEIKFQVVISSYERKQGIKQNNPLRERRVRAGFSDGVTFKLTYEG